jgi:DNA polymerase
MDLETVGIDWETYWSAKFSLTKLSTSEYVRDKRFRAHGFSLSRGSEGFKPRWVTHDDVPATLAAIPWERTRLVCHNMEFDGFVLAERYGYRPAQYFCTMSAARFWHQGETLVGLDKLAKFHGMGGKLEGLAATKGLYILPPDVEQQLGVYACDDVQKALVFYLKYSKLMPADEQRLMDITFRMFCDPKLEVDLELVREGFKDALRARIAKVDAADWVDPAVLRSNDKFARALLDLGIEPPMKRSKTTGKMTYAFAKGDEDFIELLDHPEARVRTLVEARIASKSTIALTRALRLFRMGRTGKLAIALNYGRAKSHRWSGSNKMNLQNFVRGSKLRRAIRAANGDMICVADSSQIEGRLNPWFCGQEDKLELFRAGGDPYNDTASAIYSRPIDRSNPEHEVEGFVGKTAELGLGYGMGAPKFQATCKRGAGGISVDLDLEFCQYVVQAKRTKDWAITAMWGTLDQWCHMLAAGVGEPITHMGVTLAPIERRIWFPNGTSMHYPDCQFDRDGNVVYRDGHQWKTLYGGKLLENIIQKLARDVIGWQMLQVAERYPIATMTHDELVWVCRAIEAEESLAFGIRIMKTSPPWALACPFNAKGGYALNYSK